MRPPTTAPPNARLTPESIHDTPARGSESCSGAAPANRGRQKPRRSEETTAPSPPSSTVSSPPRERELPRRTEKAAGTCSRIDTSEVLACSMRAESFWLAPRQLESSRETSPVTRPREREIDGSSARKRAGLPFFAPCSTTCSRTTSSSDLPACEAKPAEVCAATGPMRGESITSKRPERCSLFHPAWLNRQGWPGFNPSILATGSPRVVPEHGTSSPRCTSNSSCVCSGSPHALRALSSRCSAHWSASGLAPSSRALVIAASIRVGAVLSRKRLRITGGSRGTRAAASEALASERRTMPKRPWSSTGGAGGASIGEKNSMTTGCFATLGSEASKTRWPPSSGRRLGTLAKRYPLALYH
mmetsp:Transcript_17709/g.49441  ORF Transcript_17709/g.49441 Transcript_17709/m.49441 type:complete len:359 (-) Transcript_17709:247-1323(-)